MIILFWFNDVLFTQLSMSIAVHTSSNNIFIYLNCIACFHLRGLTYEYFLFNREFVTLSYRCYGIYKAIYGFACDPNILPKWPHGAFYWFNFVVPLAQVKASKDQLFSNNNNSLVTFSKGIFLETLIRPKIFFWSDLFK